MKKKEDKDSGRNRLEVRYGIEPETSGECPYCHSPLVNGMTKCPKCYYDITTSDGGTEHRKWLEKKGLEVPDTDDVSIKPEEVMVTSLPGIYGYTLAKLGGMIFSDLLIKLEDVMTYDADEEERTTIFSEVRRQLVKKLQQDAAEMGANAVVNTVYSSAVEGAFFHMSLRGTAVYAQVSDEEPEDGKNGKGGKEGAKSFLLSAINKLLPKDIHNMPNTPRPF